MQRAKVVITVNSIVYGTRVCKATPLLLPLNGSKYEDAPADLTKAASAASSTLLSLKADGRLDLTPSPSYACESRQMQYIVGTEVNLNFT